MDTDTTPSTSKRGGIKSFRFTPTGTNGTSHRANAPKKQAHYRRNQAARAALYQERGRISASEWHSRLDGISKGTV